MRGHASDAVYERTRAQVGIEQLRDFGPGRVGVGHDGAEDRSPVQAERQGTEPLGLTDRAQRTLTVPAGLHVHDGRHVRRSAVGEIVGRQIRAQQILRIADELPGRGGEDAGKYRTQERYPPRGLGRA